MRLPIRSFSALLLLTYLPVASGCIHNVTTPKPDPGTTISERLAGVVLVSRRRVMFDQQNGRYEEGRIIGTLQGQEISISPDSVSHLLVRRFDALGTAGLVVGVAALAVGTAVAIAIATKESCPFVYSWDGTRYVFDAEPYGGAVSRGLARDDFGRMDHLRAVDGEYRLRVVNEVNESQWTDLMELWVIDHQPGVRPIPDEFGTLHGVAEPAAPRSARDQQEQNLLPWLEAADSLMWEPRPSADPAASIRDTVTLVFDKPEAATTMKFVARVATGAWGSHQIRSLLSRMGAGRDEWYRRVDRNPAAADSVRRWAIQEGLYGLVVEVREPDGWQVRGFLPGGGPFIAEDRIVALDVSRVDGPEVALRLRPARGFWAFDWFAADFSPERAFAVDTLRVVRAEDPRLGDVTGLLRRTDQMEHPLPTTGDHAFLRFRAPRARTGLERTVLLHSRGWYTLRGIPEWTGPVVDMDRLFAEPGLAARLSGDEFRRALLAGRM
jgi:hypothetical protein